jgi:hypothetical protein
VGDWNTMFIIDMVILGVGIYFLYLSIKMRITQKVESFIIPEETLKQCKDEKGFARFLAIRQMILSIIMIICGALMAIHEVIVTLGYGYYVVTGILVVALIVFYSELSDGRNKYC